MDRGIKKLIPSYGDATPEQLAVICNGVGPSWASKWVRIGLTKASKWFFDEACWNHHDFGYFIGYTTTHRRRCDNKFFMAMITDSLKVPSYKFILALLLSISFYIMVRIFGRFSFHYASEYRWP